MIDFDKIQKELDKGKWVMPKNAVLVLPLILKDRDKAEPNDKEEV